MKMSAKPIAITEDQFEPEVLQADGTVLVDIWGDGCAPCRTMEPILKQLAEKHADDVKVVKINFAEATDLAVALGVMGLPTLLLYRNGEKVDQHVGLKPLPELETWIQGE